MAESGGTPASNGDATEPAVVTPPPPSAFKRFVIPALKAILAGGLLWYVFVYKVDDEAKGRLRTLFDSPGVLAGAIMAFSMQLLIGAQRLRVLLRPQEVTIRYLTALRLTYLGAFFDTFMITSVGGDAVKALYLARICPKGKKLGAVSVMLLDRLLGLLGLLTLTVVMTLWNIQELHADEDIRPFVMWLFVIPALLLVGMLGLLSSRVRNLRLMQWGLKVLPFGGTINSAYASLQRFRDCPRVLFAGWTLSLFVHMFGILAGYILMRGMHQEADVSTFFVAWLIAGFMTSFAPFGGIGTGQVIYDIVFQRIAGLPSGMGVILATTFQVIVIVAKSPGFAAWLLSREHKTAPAPAPEALVKEEKGTA